MREFAFELRLCGWLEDREEGVVARQLGTSVEGRGNRILDVLLVRPGPEFDARTRLPPGEIPLAAIESDAGVGEWTPVTDAVPGPPERARRVAERAADVGYLELERKGGEAVVRRVARYPGEWFGDLVGVENKPDLGRPGDLAFQLRHDVALGLLDEVWLATESYVTGAHLNRIPDAVGVARVDADALAAGGEDAEEAVEVVREATPLDTAGAGVEVLDERPTETAIETVDGAAKARARRRLAERAYGKGWRTYGFPDCAEVERAASGSASALPYCAWKDRLVDAASECGPDCPGHDASETQHPDLDAERAAATPWNPTPAVRTRTQSRLDRWTE
ncbi:DUF5787 family protein [Halocalculus aciditolerans]|uniref:Uncharacterized protein n=1 Tax=Halocalculus aciditolerans TaxID=1383812 RepID=A0A830F858_9EURY|nr:DUF5787 family protein [Halocalculus aciditolerans]GGL49413.1 hypothetical protein GCM10009039_04510 [Halocalculus aciditolerans]